MRRTICISTAVLGLTASAFAGGGAFTDGFEGVDGELLSTYGNGWVAWDSSPASIDDATISSDFAAAGSTSCKSTGDPVDPGLADAEDLVQIFSITGGAWAIECDSYIPAGMENICYFILLNTYVDGGAKDWSLDMTIDNAAGEVGVIEDPSGTPRPIVNDAWASIRVVANIDDNTMDIFYDGEVLSGGVAWSDVGNTTFQAIDLWGDAGGIHYWDNVNVEEVAPVGACCLDDGECLDDESGASCDTAGGTFQGLGSTCAASTCPVLGPDGWLQDAPFTWNDDSCGEDDDCTVLSDGADIQWEITIPADGFYDFSICGTALWDSLMYLGSSGCSDDLGNNDDCIGGVGESEILGVSLSATDTVYLTLDGSDSLACGGFLLSVSGNCVVDTKGTIDEGEACGSSVNDGCNADTTGTQVSPLACGDAYSGTAWYDGATRDTDWYAFVPTEETDVTWGGNAEYSDAIYARVNAPGTGLCADATALDIFALVADPCTDPFAEISATLSAGTWWLFAANQFGPIVECTSDFKNYTATLTCVEACPWDVDGNDDVGFTDLTGLLANWGPVPPMNGAFDFDGNNDVGFTDLTTLLAKWGPCP